MSRKLWLVGGLATGYVLGTRAGRERYEQLVETAHKVKQDPSVHNVVETVTQQAGRAYANGRAAITEKLENRRRDKADDDIDAELIETDVIETDVIAR